MPVSVVIKNEIGGTSSASPKNMSGTKTLTVEVNVSATASSLITIDSETEAPITESVTEMVPSALGATLAYITVSLQDGSNGSSTGAVGGSSAGTGITQHSVTLNIANGDARLNQVCKLTPHAIVNGADIAGTPLNFIKIV